MSHQVNRDSDVRGTDVQPNTKPKFESEVDGPSAVQVRGNQKPNFESGVDSAVNPNNKPVVSNVDERDRKKADKNKKKKGGCFGCF